jgi:zinc D-Ala-D-Ala carboxypeptidase
MKLSSNFSLAELTKSSTALRRGIDNTPNNDQVHALRQVALMILQPSRDHFGIAFSPGSGFRIEALEWVLCENTYRNRCKRKGLDPDDKKNWNNYFSRKQHPKGEAVDSEIPGVSNYDYARWIQGNLDFDQLILECYTPGEPSSGWVHCSYVSKPENRNQVLTFDGKQYLEGLVL